MILNNAGIRDNLALLAEGANVRIVSLDKNAEIAKQQAALMQVIANTSQALLHIEQKQKNALRVSRICNLALL